MEKNNLFKSYMAAVYLRLSKEDEDLSLKTEKSESNSIANQKALILKELKSMPDVTLFDIYIDDGFTGLNFERPAFRRMRNDIYEGKINMVIVKDLSRLGRDYIESGRYVKKIFPSLNVRFVSVLDHFDSLTASQSDMNLLIPVKNFVNDNYSRDISGKVRSHQEVMRENGLYVGAYVAYGYKKAENDKNRIEPDEYSADIVKRIFAWKLDGMNAGAIADKLNQLGVIPPSEYKRLMGINYKSGFQKNSKAQWTAVTVTRILKNKIYIGVLEQGKREKVNYKLDKVVEKPESEWAVIEGSHEPIISRTDYENVERLLCRDTRTAPAKKNLYLFSGLLFCGECNRSMVRRQNKYKHSSYVYYICSTYNKGKGCTRHSIEESTLKEIVLDSIKRHIEQIAELDQILQMTDSMEIQCEDVIANDTEILAKYDELNKCKKMELTLHKDLFDGMISKEEYIQFSQIYSERAETIEKSIQALRQEIETIFQNGLLSNEWIRKFASNRNIDELDRTILLLLVEKIIIHEDCRIEIIFKYNDKYKTACRIAENLSEPARQGVNGSWQEPQTGI
ncbi:recombinase family protein [Lachnospiraceae bacterium WCA-9-b2]|uniref:Recombinase family protein n=1 Tax=Sporofaciens musculi TaxID=2681861 RepID=A0A7X3MCV0_9FIRM|nr:recombinase family protein [Sporofaciens musculi]MXP74088.1 recombinase family protein [Sporofaciens musculi]